MRRLLCVLGPLALLLAGAPAANAAALAPASQQVLKVGIVQPVDRGSLDPSQLSYLDSVNFARLSILPLYEANANGTLRPVLASGAPIVSSDRRSIVVRLRAARWSDGRPIVAANVVTAWRRSSNNYFAGFLTNVRGVVAVNSRTVRFSLRRSDPVVLAMLGTHILSPLPTHVIARAGSRWTNPGTMVASGPFRLTARTSTKWTFAKNARYFGATAVRLARVEVHVTGTKAKLLNGMRSGAYHTTLQNMFAPSTSFDGTNVITQSAPTQAMQYLYINTREVADARVRRAIALAVDRAGIVGISGGAAATAIVPGNMPLASVATAGTRLLATRGTPDVAAAQAQLAGTSSVGTLRLAYTSDSTNGRAIAEKVRDSLAAVGITVTLVPFTSTQFATTGVGISPTRSDIDLVLQGWIVDYPDLWDFYQLFICANVSTGINTSNYCNTSFDTLTRPLASQFTSSARGTTFAKLEQFLTGPEGTFPAVPLYQQVDRVHRQSWLRALLPTADGYIRWTSMAIEVH